MSLLLYHAIPSRGAIARWMLEEIGQPYQVRLLNLKAGENREPAYLKINPMGKIPAVVHDGVVITENAAIACYLADAFPQAHLTVPIGDPRRGPYLKWLFFGPSCIEPPLLDKMLNRPAAPISTAGWGNFDLVIDVLKIAIQPGPYLFGDHFTAADVIIGSQLRWGLMFKGIPELPEFVDYVKRLEARPALKRATEKDAAAAS
jgi:glutathione S-transferase